MVEDPDGNAVLVTSGQRARAPSIADCSGRSHVKFGLELNDFRWSGGPAAMGEHVANIGRRAEKAGFDSIWVWDHFIQLRQWEDRSSRAG